MFSKFVYHLKIPLSLGPVYEFVCISFRTDIILTVFGQVNHGGQDGNAAGTRIRDETSEIEHTQKRRFRHGAICRSIKALAILMWLYGSEMVLLGVVITKCVNVLPLIFHKKMVMTYL